MSFYKKGSSTVLTGKSNFKKSNEDKPKMIRGNQVYNGYIKGFEEYTPKNPKEGAAPIALLTLGVDNHYDLKEYIVLNEKGLAKVSKIIFDAFKHEIEDCDSLEEFMGQVTPFINEKLKFATYTRQQVYSKDGVMNVNAQAKFSYAGQVDSELAETDYKIGLSEDDYKAIAVHNGEVKNWINDERVNDIIDGVGESPAPDNSKVEEDDDLPF